MVVLYKRSKNKKFQRLVRSVIVLPFIRLSELQGTVDCLRTWSFETKKEEEYKQKLLNYIQSYWIDGVFPPQVWNCLERDGDYTNNNQEGHNSGNYIY